MIIGAQLYSVRDKCVSEETIKATFKAMKEIGYTSVQISGFPYDAQKARDYADEYGLHIGLTHTAIDQIINNTQQIIKNHKILKADMIGIGFPGGYYNDGVLETDRLIADLTPAVHAIQDAGLKFGYHNHAIEFKDLGGYYPLDILFEKTNWNFILDVGWVDVAGADAVKAVEKYVSRLEYVHLKDFRAAKEANEPDGHRIVSLYKGNVPLDSILSALKKAGTKVAYVEQDNAVEKNSYEEMKNSYEALKERGWTN